MKTHRQSGKLSLRRGVIIALFFLFVVGSSLSPRVIQAQQAALAAKPSTVEWVYRVKYGYKDEWWAIFKKYQLAILDRQKQLGYVKEYTVWAPGLHTSEDSRWDYRIVIVRASGDAPAGQSDGEIGRQLFPDQQEFKKSENRRWELTTNHWDLPIHQVDTKAIE